MICDAPVHIPITFLTVGISKHTFHLISHLRSNSMRPGGKQLCNTRCIKPSLGQTKCSPQACSSCTHNNCIKLMVHNWILCRNLEKIIMCLLSRVFQAQLKLFIHVQCILATQSHYVLEHNTPLTQALDTTQRAVFFCVSDTLGVN